MTLLEAANKINGLRLDSDNIHKTAGIEIYKTIPAKYYVVVNEFKRFGTLCRVHEIMIYPHQKSESEKDRLLFGSTGSKLLNGTLKKRSVSAVKESDVHLQVCKYLKLAYPDVLFLSDFAAGMKMTKGMANRQTMLKSNHSFPDLMILEPCGGYYGLFIELKRDRSALYKKDGSYIKSEHIEAQRGCIEALSKRGYAAQFACGLDEAKNVIDTYLKDGK